MKTIRVLQLLVVTVLLCNHTSACQAAAPATGPLATICAGVPAGLGINIHFTNPRPREMDQLAASGVKWVRMDIAWSDTERSRDRYDFRAYDTLMRALEDKGMRAILILDYGNPLYDQGQAPRTDAGRAAFTKWAVAAVTHFRHKGVIWEMWNEPNGSFWKPGPDVAAYAKLAMEVGQAFQDQLPDETLIGPATSGIDMDFLESCLKAGCLKYWSAVSVHPYRPFVPETAAADYERVRALISKYAPAEKHIDLICSEWGYPSVFWQQDATQQAKYLVRQWLTNLSAGIPLSIWYDWHDDGTSVMNPEHHFGIVEFKYPLDGSTAYNPKPAYNAVKTFTRLLNGFHFDRRVPTPSAADYALAFRNGSEERWVVWTTKASHAILLPIHDGTFSIYLFEGDSAGSVSANQAGLAVKLSDAPMFLIPGEKH